MVNGDADYQNWKVSQAQFQGFMKAKIENICATLDKVTDHNEKQDIRIVKCEHDLVGVKIKGGIFGTIGGIIGGFLGGFLR